MVSFMNESCSYSGCLGIDVELAMLTELIEKSPVGETGYVILVQDDGTILANPRHKEFNLKKLTETGVAALAALNSISEGGMEVDMDGTRWFAQVKTIEGLNWKLVGFIEKDEVLQNFHAMLVKMAIIGTAISLSVNSSKYTSCTKNRALVYFTLLPLL